MEGSMSKFQDFPEHFIVEILQHVATTPVDTCSLSFVSKAFNSAIDYDILWDRFFPSDLFSLIPPTMLPSSNSKKALYFALCDHPTIIDQGSKSFQLDKRTGKKCFMFSARDLAIELGEPPVDETWSTWTNLSESRFEEVLLLSPTSPLYILRWIDLNMLSPNTEYEGFLVFKLINDNIIENHPQVSINFFGGAGIINETNYKFLLLERTNANLRKDGWLEIEIGSFNSGLAKEDEVLVIIESGENHVHNPTRFYLEGIEVRPKDISLPSMCFGQP